MTRLTTLLAMASAVSAVLSIPVDDSAVDARSCNKFARQEDTDDRCQLPPALDPSDDGLPSAREIYGSDEALEKQLKRFRRLIEVPSICYDDLGEPTEDERWEVFYDVHEVLNKTYPTV